VKEFKHKFYCCFLFCGLVVQWAVAQQIDAKLLTSTDNLIIGQPIVLELSASLPPGYPLLEPKLENLLPTELEQVEKPNNKENSNNQGQIKWRQTYALMAFDSGQYLIPKIGLTHADGDTLHTQPITFRVNYPNSYISKPDSIARIEEIWEEPASIEDYLLWFVALGLLVLALVAYFIYRRYKNRPPTPPKTVPVIRYAPKEIALKKLEELATKQLWQNNQVKAYYIELDYILREFLENEHQLNALESVSSEIMQALESNPTLFEQERQFRQFFNTTDMTKFAKSIPDVSIHENAFLFVKQIVQIERTPSNG
jgi:hypothetical protein